MYRLKQADLFKKTIHLSRDENLISQALPARSGVVAACAAVLSLSVMYFSGAGVAQAASPQATPQLNPQQAAAATAQGKSRMLVEAREMVYDRDKDTVAARGDAQIYYQGRVLEADRITYDRKTKRVYAEGKVKITETNGTKFYGDRFELTDDVRDGFIDSLRVETPDKQRISAARGERIGGNYTVFERGIYTACEPCKDDPAKPPLWQVRAARIIQDSEERTVYYENASLEFFGVPVFYAPYFSGPDPSVNKKTGWLAPTYIKKGALGFGVSLPFFWDIAPNYDLTLTPTLLTRQGVLGQAEWRHRLAAGSYNIRLAGIYQATPSAFLPSPLGAGNRDFRGSVESMGKFHLNEKWRWGWDIAASTDKFFFNNYKVKSESVQTTYAKESVSTVYLNGQTDRSYFDLRGYDFRGLTTNDWQKQMPDVHPSFDFNRRFAIPVIQGEFGLNVNVTSISRKTADYQAIPVAGGALPFSPPRLFNGYAGQYPYNLYEGCAVYQKSSCLLRGIGGNYQRGTVMTSWRRAMVDPLGQVWTPFFSMRADAAWYNLDTGHYATGVGDSTVFGNDKQLGYLNGQNNSFASRIMPTMGFEYRYPFIAVTENASHILEPIAQVVARPKETRIGRMPNEDAQSLVFDDTNIFAINKFSGYDRVEGGVRANVGAQYTFAMNKGGYANMLFGQSYHLAGANSYNIADTMNTGLQSGLETRRSDFVGRIQVVPTQNFSLTTRARFDEKTFALRRLEASANVNFGDLSASATYARIARQPDLGYDLRREGLQLATTYKLPRNWYVSSSVLFDMDRHLYDAQVAASNPTAYTSYNRSPWRVAALQSSLGYRDECTDLRFTYARSIVDTLGGEKRNGSTYLFQLELKHLGQVALKENSGLGAISDTSVVSPR